MSEARFQVAGLDVALRSSQPHGLDGLAPGYQICLSTGASPDLVIDIERVAGFHTGRERTAEYPAFRRIPRPHGLRVERYDAEGEIDTRDDVVAARFTVGDSPNSLEACIRIAASVALPRRGALIVHGSAVMWDGRATVFAGVSGAGKSTIAAMLAEAYPAATRLTDELTVVRRDPDGWAVHVPPFLGAAVPHGQRAPLAGVAFLVQAPRHHREPMAMTAALRELLRHVLAYVAEPLTAAAVLGAASDLTSAIPCWRLEFKKDPDVGQVLGIT